MQNLPSMSPAATGPWKKGRGRGAHIGDMTSCLLIEALGREHLVLHDQWSHTATATLPALVAPLRQIPQPCCAVHALASCLQSPEIIPSAPVEGQQLQLKGVQWPTEWLLPRTPAKWQGGPGPWPEEGGSAFLTATKILRRRTGKPNRGKE